MLSEDCTARDFIDEFNRIKSHLFLIDDVLIKLDFCLSDDPQECLEAVNQIGILLYYFRSVVASEVRKIDKIFDSMTL